MSFIYNCQPDEDFNPFVTDVDDINYENTKTDYLFKLNEGDGIVVMEIANECYTRGVPYTVAKKEHVGGWVRQLNPTTYAPDIIEIKLYDRGNSLELEGLLFEFRRCHIGPRRSTIIPSLFYRLFSPDEGLEVNSEAVVRKCYLEELTAKVVSVGSDGRSLEFVRSWESGTTHHAIRIDFQEDDADAEDDGEVADTDRRQYNEDASKTDDHDISTEATNNDQAPEPDIFSSSGPMQNASYKPEVRTHIKGLLENQHMTTWKCLGATAKPPLVPNLQHENWLNDLRANPKSNNYSNWVKALPKDAKSPLRGLPNELLEMVVKWCEPGPQVMLRNTCREMRQKVPRPILIEVNKVMGLWNLQYATVMV